MALVLCIALSFCLDEAPLIGYLALLNEPLKRTIGSDALVELFVAVVMFVWPQVVIAYIGGALSRMFKVTITRR
jgi:hypothetical protein